ncbi:lipocalin family protein [Pedobacter sp. GSP4]|uniref:lipocalin family protein n=1 Tax=Pedobacter sp. GSP4 TaxID=3453716 RepID=UPI003EECC499
MKKYLTLLLLCPLLYLSCKKQNSSETQPPEVDRYTDQQVIGKWVYQSLKVNGTAYPYPHRSGCGKDCFYFMNRPSQDHDYVELTHLNANCALSTTNMDWKLKGENLILNFGAQQFTYKILRLTQNNFDVLVTMDYDGDGKADNLEIYATRENCTTGDPYCQN